MTIEQISDTKVLISLCSEDMKYFDISFDSKDNDNIQSQRIISRILQVVCAGSDLKIKNKCVMLEAVPTIGGCMLFVSVSDKKNKRKKYRIKHIKEYPCYMFDTVEIMLNAIEKLYNSDMFFYNNSIYLSQKKYYLIFDYPIVSNKAKRILCEYAQPIKGTKVFIARLSESAKLISGSNAIMHIGESI